MAAMVAGRVALGLGVTPNVCPRCTGAVDGFTLESCAGMAAVRADLGCGANVTICGLAFGFGNTIWRSCNCTLGGSGGGMTGGGGCLIFTGGGGVVGMISSVIS